MGRPSSVRAKTKGSAQLCDESSLAAARSGPSAKHNEIKRFPSSPIAFPDERSGVGAMAFMQSRAVREAAGSAPCGSHRGLADEAEGIGRSGGIAGMGMNLDEALPTPAADVRSALLLHDTPTDAPIEIQAATNRIVTARDDAHSFVTRSTDSPEHEKFRTAQRTRFQSAPGCVPSGTLRRPSDSEGGGGCKPKLAIGAQGGRLLVVCGLTVDIET
jgi:hypothetical protein